MLSTAGANDDYLTGTMGFDHFSGGTGSDYLHSRDGQPDVLDGGPGVDRARIDRYFDKLANVEDT